MQRPRHVPKDYTAVTPYLVVPDVDRAAAFAERVFGATVVERMEGPDGVVMHGEVRIDGAAVMLGRARDASSAFPAMLYVYVENCDATYARALAAGATSVREPADQFYGHRTGGVSDESGNQWWFATVVEDVTPEEQAQRARADGAEER